MKLCNVHSILTPAISIAGYGRDSARAAYNAARQSRGIAITATHQSQRSGLDDEMPVISKVTGIPTGEFSKTFIITILMP